MKSISNKLASLLLIAGAWVGSAAHAVQDLPGGPAVNQLNLHPPVTKIAEEQHFLHWMMLIICTVIFVAVFSVMFYSIWKHRRSKGAKSANFHESVTVEVVWTIVPFIIVILMALPATKVLVAQKDTTNADVTIKTTGYQWKWGYDYITGEGEGIGFISTLDSSHRVMSDSGNVKDAPVNYLLKVDNPMVVPVDKKIRIITTANDVIHAFMVPAFGIKQDAIPGFVRRWQRGTRLCAARSRERSRRGVAARRGAGSREGPFVLEPILDGAWCDRLHAAQPHVSSMSRPERLRGR